jgi:hypothetical protein
VRIGAKCKHCAHVLSGRSSAGTGHLLRHHKVCVAKTKHDALVQSRLQLKADGTVLTMVLNSGLRRLATGLPLWYLMGYSRHLAGYSRL